MSFQLVDNYISNILPDFSPLSSDEDVLIDEAECGLVEGAVVLVQVVV